MRFSKSLRIAAVAASVAVFATACGGGEDDTTDTTSDTEMSGDESEMDDTDGESDAEAAPADLTLVTEGTLTVCSEVPYAPFEVEDADAPSGYSGFDIDLVQAIADDLGLELAVVNAGFDDLTSGAAMAAGTCDFAASAMTINDEREENVDFSDGYYNAAQSLMVKADAGIATLDDLAGMNIGVQSGTTGEAYAQENAPEDAELVAFDAGADLFVALESGNIDAILQDLPVNVERAAQDDTLDVVETYETDENYGFAFPEDGADALVAAVNESLSSLRSDGTYDDIYSTYFDA